MAYENTLILFGILAIFNLAVFLPLLLSSSVRRLFGIIPSDNLFLNYLLGVTGFTVLHSALLFLVVVLFDGLDGTAVLWGLGLVPLFAGSLTYMIVSFLLPRKEVWNPKKAEEVDGRIVLAIGLLWYLISIAGGLFIMLVLAISFFFPG